MKTILDFLLNYKRLLPYIAIILLIVYISECTTNNHRIKKPEPCPQIATDSIISYKHDTITLKGKVILKPLPYYVDNIVHDTVFKTHRDTLNGFIDYQSSKFFKLPIQHDTNANLDLFLTLQYNKVKNYNIIGEIYPHTTIIEKNHVIIEKPRIRGFLGLQAGYSLKNNVPVLIPTFAVTTKKSHTYTFGYDIVGKTPVFGAYVFITTRQR